jgi:tetratricopeptide (TPR) repeat protein
MKKKVNLIRQFWANRNYNQNGMNNKSSVFAREAEINPESELNKDKHWEFQKDLFNLDKLINSPTPHSSYFSSRAFVYDKLNEFDKAIYDTKIAIQMDPDNPDYYWQLGGYLVSNEMLLYGKMTENESSRVLEEAGRNYIISLSKDPANECAWINLIEINIFLKKWDEAISYFGSCKSYIMSNPFQLIRSFLGSLALISYGDDIDTTDLKILLDVSIRITDNNYRVCEIESFIFELEESGFDKIKINKLKEILKLFISHYENEPRRYGLKASRT